MDVIFLLFRYKSDMFYRNKFGLADNFKTNKVRFGHCYSIRTLNTNAEIYEKRCTFNEKGDLEKVTKGIDKLIESLDNAGNSRYD